MAKLNRFLMILLLMLLVFGGFQSIRNGSARRMASLSWTVGNHYLHRARVETPDTIRSIKNEVQVLVDNSMDAIDKAADSVELKAREAKESVQLALSETNTLVEKSLPQPAAPEEPRVQEEVARARMEPEQMPLPVQEQPAVSPEIDAPMPPSLASVLTISPIAVFRYGINRTLVMRQDSVDAMARMAAMLPEHSMIHIAGFSDSSGSLAAQEVVSWYRALGIADQFKLHGISPDKIFAKGYGAIAPVGDPATSEGSAASRRVEVRIVPAKFDLTSERKVQ